MTNPFWQCQTYQDIKNRVHEMYLDWFNNFLSVTRFAEHYEIERNLAVRILDLGRRINHRIPTRAERAAWQIGKDFAN